MTTSADEMFQRALFGMQTGKLDDAERSLKRAIQLQPGHLPALDVYSIFLTDQGRHEEAGRYARRTLAAYDEVLQRKPHLGAPWFGRGNVLYRLGRILEAIDSYDRAIVIEPNFSQAHLARAKLLVDLCRFTDALVGVDKLLAIEPNLAEAWLGRGNIVLALKRYDDALAACERALALKPGLAEAWVGRGNAFKELRQYDEALVAYEKALGLNFQLAGAWHGRGNVFYELGRYQDAIAAYDKALALSSDLAKSWLGRGKVFRKLKLYQDALAAFDRALGLKANLSDAWLARGDIFRRLKRHEEAAEAYTQALRIDPQLSFVKGALLYEKMATCTWQGIDDLTAQIEADIASGKLSGEPFGWQGVAKSPSSLRLCAELYNADRYPAKPGRAPQPLPVACKKIRIGYLSGELRDQATSHLMVGVFEHHDRSRFEIYGFDSGWNDSSDIRRRIEKAISPIVDISGLTDDAAAATIRDQNIDILVNLNGYFGEERTGVFAQRPAPIQVNYLGFPGTLGASYIDYLIADQQVIPLGHEEFYVEKVAYLPGCYQANDDKKSIASRIFSRAECGLPERAFVFCCFNNSYKITPEVFDCWMRILGDVAGSVLWLIEDSALAVANLRKEAADRGVNPERLVFAQRIALADHLARHRMADLFLDTLPYNAHTTASDALWAGLPIITQLGETFPGRVAASLLASIGLSELVTSSQDGYRALAVELATDAQKLAAVKRQLVENRDAAPLFDTRLFTRRIETAYNAMYERFRSNLVPESMFIDP